MNPKNKLFLCQNSYRVSEAYMLGEARLIRELQKKVIILQPGVSELAQIVLQIAELTRREHSERLVTLLITNANDRAQILVLEGAKGHTVLEHRVRLLLARRLLEHLYINRHQLAPRVRTTRGQRWVIAI